MLPIAGAQAADLPTLKSAPVEFVRVCNAYGAGFFYIPGTDTCLRISGRARYDFLYQTSKVRTGGGGDLTGYLGLMRINLDARTQTDYGTLRAFLRVDVANRSGPFLTSGSRQRESLAIAGLGADAFGRTQTYINADKAFIQFAGLTAGRASSFFDFYAHDFELIGGTAGSDTFSTNLLAYSATLGNGVTLTAPWKTRSIAASRSSARGPLSAPSRRAAGSRATATPSTRSRPRPSSHRSWSVPATWLSSM